ncbi:MAG TPA: hypothetical protein VME70_12965 [Mycobacteriales bacterium]|nr:hypothetical protein [Mycobacteriales bacterium]
MVPLPSDPAFGWFVDGLRATGASPQTIASALNHSVWADPNGGRWHGRQVEALLAEPALRPAADADDDADPLLAFRRLALLRMVRDWRPVEGWHIERLWCWHQGGGTIRSMARRLNQAAVPAPDGGAWTGTWVSVLLYLRMVTAAGDAEAAESGSSVVCAA